MTFLMGETGMGKTKAALGGRGCFDKISIHFFPNLRGDDVELRRGEFCAGTKHAGCGSRAIVAEPDATAVRLGNDPERRRRWTRCRQSEQCRHRPAGNLEASDAVSAARNFVRNTNFLYIDPPSGGLIDPTSQDVIDWAINPHMESPPPKPTVIPSDGRF